MSIIAIIGGGTIFHIRPHLALSAPAYGGTAVRLSELCHHFYGFSMEVDLYLTRMADYTSRIETNADVANLVEKLVSDAELNILFMPVALCDFDVSKIDARGQREFDSSELAGDRFGNVGKRFPRIRTDDVRESGIELELTVADKVISQVRKQRKDIFLVGFKTTTGATEDEQFNAGLKLLKKSSCNLVLANDLTTKLNMIITPEQARYSVTNDRDAVLKELVNMTASRHSLTFTRSTVVPGEPVKWNSEDVPPSLRAVVNHCIKRGAYRPFLGSTVGHFAVKVDDSTFLTSMRKSNFNYLNEGGLVKVETKGKDEVIAYGGKPSVGGQSQRIVFAEHPDTDCIVHAHVQLRPGSKVPVKSQKEYECGSHECGSNTSSGLQKFGDLYAVMLDKHGPNIVFNRNIDPSVVIKFIEENFDLEHQTSELS